MNKIIYSLNKIVYHNSCNSNIVSLDLSKNTHMSGNNGAGKTSRLNGVQIGYLPHMNFKDIKRKYNFFEYTTEETYNFYFPENDSYIIYEFTNQLGTFCQIIYKGREEYSIERAFVPLSMDDIYHWFWILNDDDEVGHPTRIQISELLNKVRDIPEHKIVKKASDVKKILYTYDFLNQESLYSIACIGESKVDNLIDIFKLTSNANEIKGELLRKNIISLLNSSYQNKETDIFEYDPIENLEKLEHLQIEYNSIVKRKNYIQEFDFLSEAFKNFADDSKKLKHNFNLYYQSAEYWREKTAKSIKDLEYKKEKLNKENAKQNNDKNNQKSIVDELTNNIAVSQKTIDRNQGKLDILSKHIDPEEGDFYFDYQKGGFSAVSEAMEDAIIEIKSDLKRFKDLKSTQIRYDKDCETLKNLELQKENLIKTKNNLNNLLISSGKIENPEVFHAINSNFGSITIPESEEVIKRINDFTSLFTLENNSVYFNDTKIGFISYKEKPLKDIENEISKLEGEITALNNSISKDKELLSSEFIQKEKELSDELKEIQKYRKMVDCASEYDEEIKKENNNIILLNKRLCNESKILEDIKNNIKISKNNFSQVDEEMKVYENKVRSLDSYIRDLNNFIKNNSYRYVPVKIQSHKEFISNLNDEHINEINKSYRSIQDNMKIIDKNLNIFIKEEIIYDYDGLLMQSNKSYKEIRDTLFLQLVKIYSSIESDEKVIEESTSKQYEMTMELSKRVGKYINHFNTYIRTLNEKLAGFQISNLDGLKLSINYNPEVKNFSDVVSSYGFDDENSISLLRNDFVEKVRIFIKNMGFNANSKNNKLDTEKVINSINVEYNRNGSWTTKEPSNGQGIIVKMVLLSLFINEICDDNVLLQIPVNLDETGNIDSNNIEELRKFLAEQKLMLFSASPSLQYSDMSTFKNRIMFDDCFTDEKERVISKHSTTTYHYFMGDMIEETNDVPVVDFNDMKELV